MYAWNNWTRVTVIFPDNGGSLLTLIVTVPEKKIEAKMLKKKWNVFFCISGTDIAFPWNA